MRRCGKPPALVSVHTVRAEMFSIRATSSMPTSKRSAFSADGVTVGQLCEKRVSELGFMSILNGATEGWFA